MARQAQQIVSLAAQIAKGPAYLVQAGQLLNDILRELAETYNFEAALRTTTLTLTPSLGSGPYPLPSDYGRMALDEFFYFVDGVPYKLINIDLAEFDSMVQVAGVSTFPLNWATDISRSDANGNLPVLYVWPPSGGSYVATIRYYSIPPDIVSPETSPAVPWFPGDSYLIRRLSGDLMALTGDARQEKFLGDGPTGAQGILRRILNLQEDDNGRGVQIHLDRRYHGVRWDQLPASKMTGW